MRVPHGMAQPAHSADDNPGMLKSFLTGLTDLLAPPRCAACRSPLLERALGFCDACRPLLEPAPSGDEDLHRDAFHYGGPLRDAVRRLKYEGASELAPALGALLIEPARAFAGAVDCVTAVPLHPRRLRERGYNQSLLLARPVARRLGVPLAPSLVRRVRDTAAQVGKGQHERNAQLARAFVASERVRGRAVLIIDDVRTTGATLRAVAVALEARGARALFTLALAGAYDEHDLAQEQEPSE